MQKGISYNGVVDKFVRLSKAEKKAFTKARARERKQDRKRAKEDLNSMRDLSLTEYHFSDGFRRAYAKRRWINRNISDVLNSEFNVASDSLIKKRIASGDIRINDQATTPDYILKDLDLLSHRVHRHELPILDLPIKIIYENDDILVVNKPPSMPAHPCGVYGFNSLLTILAKEMDRSKVRLLHRLDRVTSGIMIFAKNYDKANELAALIKSRSVEKYYLCSVEGNFIEKYGTEAKVVEKALGSLCPKMGLQWIDEVHGKSAFTAFKGIAYSKELDETLVLCRIYTGRTHQIRIHLQYLGFPIKNDPLYNTKAWGPTKGTLGQYTEPKELLVENITKERSKDLYYTYFDRDIPSSEGPSEKILRDEFYCPNCDVCNQKTKPIDPPRDNLILRLHSYHYKLPDMKFSALPLPPWSEEYTRESGQEVILSLIDKSIEEDFDNIQFVDSALACSTLRHSSGDEEDTQNM